MAYNYNPANITGDTIDRMRFELGDTNIGGGAATAFLSDEEIDAMRSAHPWKRAKLELVKGVCMRLSFEVDVRNDGTTISLNQRADRWMALRDKLEAELKAPGAVPDSVLRRMTREPDRGHYFHEGMLGNPRGTPPPDEAFLDRV